MFWVLGFEGIFRPPHHIINIRVKVVYRLYISCERAYIMTFKTTIQKYFIQISIRRDIIEKALSVDFFKFVCFITQQAVQSILYRSLFKE